MDIRKTLLPYSGPWTSVHYNKIFHPNLCHVCKKTTEVINLTTCDRCFSISYCSEDHKNLHFPQHSGICTAIEKFLKNNPQYLTRRFDHIEWSKTQNKFRLSIEQDLGRALENYETEMFFFARSCFICFQQTGLYSCKKCLSIDYCLEHKKEFAHQHEQFSCDRFTTWLNLELSNVQYENTVSLSLKFMKLPDNDRSLNNMEKFIEEYVQNKKGEWNILDYIYSDYVSGPLSVYYGMLHAGLSDVLLTASTYVIHIIEADSIERNGLPAWEILLHLFPNIQVLIVVLLGTDLQYELGIQDICPRCVCNKKKFIYECCGVLYSNYMITPTYGRADLIVVFEVFDSELLGECLKTMQSQECPVLLTSLKEDTALCDIAEIHKVLGRDVCPVIGTENKFRSLRPYRDFQYIFYRNSFLTVYKTLNNTNSTIESSNEKSNV
ncbi:uncharacterized protein LOC112588275 [Harpegnathos saltator]|uniref:Uncharacterized protein n=1 Tax=Harpegnathos saltator TaxID=610380 RepID=E2B4C8_HARSA|nr:uncharacterized protein LOC112588275 [Harpegnathos saltator]EFN89476.1 hypothetical protein EAI_06077 [Harpegnathos saltator]